MEKAPEVNLIVFNLSVKHKVGFQTLEIICSRYFKYYFIFVKIRIVNFKKFGSLYYF